MSKKVTLGAILFLAGVVVSLGLLAVLGPGQRPAATADEEDRNACRGLPSHATLKTALTPARKDAHGGFDHDM